MQRDAATITELVLVGEEVVLVDVSHGPPQLPIIEKPFLDVKNLLNIFN